MAEQILDVASFIRLIREHQSFGITTHVNPDGDALGSEIGLAEWLLSIGKSVRVINHSPTPYNYMFFDEERPIIEQHDPQKHEGIVHGVDVILVLDVNDPERTRSLGKYLTGGTQHVAVIDHHLNPKPFAKEYFLDTDASSTGEMIVRLVRAAQPELGGTISKKAANALYVAIMTDSGSFRFPRTDSELLRMCADLIDLGADPVRTYHEVYNTSPAGRLLLLRDALNSLEYHYDGHMAFQCIMQAQLHAANADEEDVDGFVQMPFQVGGIVLSVFLLELKEGWKISTRSKDPVSAAMFAQSFGGNGHFNAAGARVHGEHTLAEMHERIVANAETVLAAAGLLTPQAA
ncbi:MAG: DHH family phosphoesterase [Bacteroidota bacterium]|nr:DHH family phosphoesterase [Bacteroidota bacterium]MDP4234575.1 DHH family phosphoesterase [Bacteroidota bacterium]MDP4243704.1 DHH family phosphoesterase [Bacteroidota bacterium]MDP4288348.1 DHH family phosphoesterase [Bacteroidota bacterium]